MEKNVKGVYTSDGNPDKISYPADSTIKIGDALEGQGERVQRVLDHGHHGAVDLGS